MFEKEIDNTMSKFNYPINCRQNWRDYVSGFIPGRYYLCVRYADKTRFTEGCAYLCCQTGTTSGQKYLVDDWGRLYSVVLGTVAEFIDLEEAQPEVRPEAIDHLESFKSLRDELWRDNAARTEDRWDEGYTKCARMTADKIDTLIRRYEQPRKK